MAEAGELFYNIAAKVYLWGGLYELNSEYSPLEALDGRENDPAEHYFKFDPLGFAYDSGRARYLEQFAFLRTGPGNKYLRLWDHAQAAGYRTDGHDDDLVSLQH